MHKKGHKTDVNNYRPMSLLRVMPKILEKITYKKLFSFLKQASFFYHHQFGFRKNHSTSNAFIIESENITRAFKDKKYTMGAFFDLSRAFHPLITASYSFKLRHPGMRELPYDWFSRYSSNRFIRTEANGNFYVLC